MRNHQVKIDKISISINATPDEQKKFNSVRKALKRNSNSDLIRYLLNEKYDEIFLPRDNANA